MPEWVNGDPEEVGKKVELEKRQCSLDNVETKLTRLGAAPPVESLPLYIFGVRCEYEERNFIM
jgi:hypothetical protein